MGKNMYTRHVDDDLDELDELDELEHIHPSCMWGFVHSIDYHHWHFNLKRILLQKINPRKRLKGNRSSKPKEPGHDPGELQKLLNEEEKHFHSTKESGLNHKRSLKARIKSLIAEDMSKEENGKQRLSNPSQSRFQRTYSIHHLDPPYDHGLGEVCTAGTKLPDPTKVNVIDKPEAFGKNTELSNKDASKDKSKEHANVLKIFKVNQELFLEIVQDKDGSYRKFSHTSPGSNAKSRLTKSGSFPAALLQKRSLEPSKLKQKQNEIWSVPKGEKFPTAILMPKVEKFKYSKHVRSKSLPSEYSSRGGKLGQALSFILESTTKSDVGKHEVLIPSKESKQSVQFEVKKGRNEANSSCLSVLREVSSECDSSTIDKDSAQSCEKTATSRIDEEHSFISHETEEYYSSKTSRFHNRSSSLFESVDKYTRLFENNFGKEVNLHQSKSLKLRNEYEMESGGIAPIPFRRIRSLSHSEIYSSLQNGAHEDVIMEDWPITTVEENSGDKKGSYQDELKPAGCFPTPEENVPPEDIEESSHANELPLKEDGHIHQMGNLTGSREYVTSDCSTRMEDLDDEADALRVEKSNSYREQESKCSVIVLNELPPLCPGPAFEGEVSSSIEFEISEGLENRCDHFDEDSSMNYHKSFDVEPCSPSSSMPNLENLNHVKDAELGGSYTEQDADLDYVKDILDHSGFAKDAFHKTWHSSNQPLNPLIFDEMEAYWHKECSGDDYYGCYHHQHLFDLVNEKLLHIYNLSFTYYPKALSSSCYIRLFPVGDHIVEEICTIVSTLMNLKPDQKQSLDNMVGLDMGKDDGWMNLQLESECVALELEDMIFDELLEQVVCS